MKKITTLLFLAGLAMVGGCVPSLHGIFTDKDGVFEERLLGFWSTEDGEESWRFTKAGPKKYHTMFIDENGKSLSFDGRLVRLEGKLFLDLYPDEQSRPDNAFIVPAHIFIHIKQIEPTLKMAMMDPNKLKKLLDETPELIRHEKVEDCKVVLTAPTKALQAFLVKYAEDERVFGDADSLVRMVPLR